MSLYHKYRPQTLEEVKGNTDIILSLQNMLLTKEKCPHSFLIYGETGCGKTTIGRIIAKELGCKGYDFREVDSGQFRGIDTIREIRENATYQPLEGDCRVWLLDEVHKATNDAQNALLKILEDPPSHAYFILCTTDPQKLLSTIRGRCQQFQVKPLNEQQMVGLLRNISRGEKERIPLEILEQISQNSLGHPRNAIQILEQVLSVPLEKRAEVALKAAEEQSEIIELCRALLQRSNWKLISKVLLNLKDQEPETIRRIILGYMQSVLLKSDNVQAGFIMEQMIEPFYNTGFPGLTFACYSIYKSE
jgi:DNA polymerase III subunit gamma/tau